ncbi:MAG: CbiX/SirB N-terminal domain-containing protein [Deltaproteobacteria bacterium]|nr:CbiX/SirB N-terminal domain-containing protein [Deltaproteobacteria bacterium]MBW2413178.1 CbiX/SirB N-terminal domain-containing protein [Deltaproteobacteria bacterium]
MTRALIILDHGSRRPEAHLHLEGLADRVRARDASLSVFTAHLELAEPSLADAIRACVQAGHAEVAIHPLFLIPGNHVARDIPEIVAEAAGRHPELRIRVLEPIGDRPELASLVLATLQDASSGEE